MESAQLNYYYYYTICIVVRFITHIHPCFAKIRLMQVLNTCSRK